MDQHTIPKTAMPQQKPSSKRPLDLSSDVDFSVVATHLQQSSKVKASTNVQPVTNALLENKVASDDDSEDGYISSNTDAEEEMDAGTPGSVVKSTKKSKSEEKFKPFNPEREAREVKEN